MLEDTFMSFSSDNGAASTFWGVNAASSWPLRGEKSTLWEGGVRVPGFVWTAKPLWQGPGSEYDRLFHVTDWLPTLYEMAGGDPAQLVGVDGVSHLQSLVNPTAAAPRNEALLNIDPVDGNAGIISDRFKLVVGSFPDGSSDWIELPGERQSLEEEADTAHQSCLNSTAYQVLSGRGANPKCGSAQGAYSTPVRCGDKVLSKAPCDSARQPCLYDIIADPCEYHNIGNEYPQVVKRLQNRLAAYEEGAVKPGNLGQDQASFPARHGATWVTWNDDVPV
ncbi:hypothetical protein V5799_013989 [Amblyomma americanum]|uniref:Sulfatase N-terminal domain-containing protein n=1 Tax=Amblyomma americanum TaxID=6943 RepID=A0AAQ4E4C2_AMBAM